VHSPPHPISTYYLGEAMWTGGAECGRLGFFGTFDGVRFREGFVAGLYGRASDDGLVAEVEVPPWLSHDWQM
jgi:hypothetical protein